MAKVYITQETNKDFSHAEQFGEIEFLSYDRADDFHSVSNSINNEKLLAHLAHKLRRFNQDEDYLVITGSPYVSAAVFWILGRMQIRRLNLLRWDNREFKYTPLKLQWRD